MNNEILIEEHDTHEAAHARLTQIQKRHPSGKFSVIQGKKSNKYHVVRHTSGGMSMVEAVNTPSFEEFLTETVAVDHSAYQRSHGKKASGKGNWIVGIGTHNIDHSKHKEGEHYIQHNGKLSDAVKKAKEVAKKHDQLRIHILP